MLTVNEITMLREENAKLREQVSLLTDALVEAVRIMARHSPQSDATIRTWYDDVLAAPKFT